jgi:putative (di)nucleoside polyphosphate hydrolase
MGKSARPPLVRARMPYRACVGAALFNAKGLVFIGRRKPNKGPEYDAEARDWQMPQGGIDGDEPAEAAARRELYEETNVRSVSLIAEAPAWYHYDLPDAALGRALQGRYRGQTQKWFAYRFEGTDDEIDVLKPAGGAHGHEFVEWRWERLDRLPELIVPFKRGVYERLAEAFRKIAG